MMVNVVIWMICSTMRNTVDIIPGSEWTPEHIESLGIQVINVDSNKFFGINLKTDSLSFIKDSFPLYMNLVGPENLDNAIENSNNDIITDLLALLRDVCYVYDTSEAAVDDFCKSLIKISGFRKHKNISIAGPIVLYMKMANKRMDARPDICILNKHRKIYLLVQEDKPGFGGKRDAESQLIAEMITAFSNNYDVDHNNNTQTMFGITMKGTYPTFYKANLDLVTLKSFRLGLEYEFHEEQILVVERLNIGSESRLFFIESVQNRQSVFSCYMALHDILLSYLD